MGLPARLKLTVRTFAALVGGLFGTLVVVIQVCNYSEGTSAEPVWAGRLCRQNVGFLWLFSLVNLFALIFFLLDNRFARFRRHAVIGLLAIYGLSMLLDERYLQSWWIVYPAVLLLVAVSIGVGARWTRPLVYVTSFVFVAQWLYGAWYYMDAEFLRESSAVRLVLSFLPGVASLLAVAFCCYVVATEER